MIKTFLTTIILLLAMTGCGKSHSSQSSNNTVAKMFEKLITKSEVYIDLVNKYQDSEGFIDTEHCDALLFSGLLAAARPDLSINIRAAANADLTQWFRRPGKDCGPKLGNSRSTISRDMMVGLFWYMWKTKDLEAADALMSQLKGNFYKLEGDGTLGELFMIPSYMNTLAEMIRAMGGPKHQVELFLPAKFSKDEGFINHIAVWHIHLRGQILGKISDHEFDVLKYNVERSPKNPLMQAIYHKYADGDQTKAIILLTDSAEWPEGTLPTTNEHCAPWPIQREYTEKDWGPCGPFKEHAGAELPVLLELVIK